MIIAEKYIVKKRLTTAQVGADARLRPVSLLEEMQVMADQHAEILGAGRSFLRKNAGIAWVVMQYVIEIAEMPTDLEQLELATWPSHHDALRAHREFMIRGESGKVYVRASSQWILIDLKTKRPLRLAEHLPDWQCVDERMVDTSFPKIPEFTPEKTTEFAVRYNDIDMNEHINNTIYGLWATESLGYEFLATHKLRGMRIAFKKEIPAATAKVFVDAAIDGGTTRHLIRIGDTAHSAVECDWSER